MKRYLFCLLLAVACLQGGAAVAGNAAAENTAGIRHFPQATVAALGQSMYRQDLAAAKATDILFQRVTNIGHYPVTGWLVGREGAQQVITFVADYDGDLRAVFEVRPDAPQEQRLRKTEKRALTPDETGQYEARRATLALIDQYCSKNYNSLVLQDPEGDGHLIYWIAATHDPDSVLLGGHYRFTVSRDWKTVKRADKLFNSCLTLSNKGEKANVGLFATYPLGDEPLETHIFLQLQTGKPFIIQTGDEKLWLIDQGRASHMKPGK